jgi:hypothetical protein
VARALLVRTPAELRETIGGREFIQTLLIAPPPDIEGEIRAALAEVFNDLPSVAPNRPESLEPYIARITPALRDLHGHGLAILALMLDDPRPPAGGEGAGRWWRTHYLVVPAEGFFRVGTDDWDIVHRFDVLCEGAITDLASAAAEKTQINVWGSDVPIRQELEGVVPWCGGCCRDLIQGG